MSEDRDTEPVLDERVAEAYRAIVQSGRPGRIEIHVNPRSAHVDVFMVIEDRRRVA